MCFAGVGMIGTVLGGAMQAFSSIQQGNQQAAQLKAQAQFQKRQAQAEEVKGGYEAYQAGRKAAFIQGSQEAGYAAAGVQGQSVDDTIKQSMAQRDMDQQAIQFSTDLEAGNQRYQAKMSLMEAKAAKRGGMFAALGDLIGVGTKLTSAFA
jgi:hypothetical protein